MGAPPRAAVHAQIFEVADVQTLQPLARYEYSWAVALGVAAHLDGVRLIDNVVIY